MPDNPGAWITTTARNRAIDRIRRRRRLREKTEQLGARCGDRSGVATIEPADEAEATRHAITTTGCG